MSQAIAMTHPADGVEITWAVEFNFSRIIPATRHAPEEGGIEIDGSYPIDVTLYPSEGEEVCIEDIQEGSILALLIEAKYPISGDDEFDAANDYLHGSY